MSGQDMIRQLVADLAGANERAKAAEAEVAGWRRAVRWRKANRWELRLWTKTGPIELGTVREGMPSIDEPDGWVAEADDLVPVTGLPDRNAACAKVCELLGIPVVLPVGGEK